MIVECLDEVESSRKVILRDR